MNEATFKLQGIEVTFAGFIRQNDEEYFVFYVKNKVCYVKTIDQLLELIK